MKKIIDWHKNFAYKHLVTSGLTPYQSMWLMWIKGVCAGIILMYLVG